MRTNSLDAAAFRCLAEYSTLIDIYSKIYEKDYDYHIKDYLEELMSFDTAKEVREQHTERINYIKQRIHDKIDKKEIKENVKIRVSRPRNINEEPPKENIKLRVNPHDEY